MKKLLILLIILQSNLYSNYYKIEDFNLKGNINKVSVVCYDITLEDGEYIEGFPYSAQFKYHTDLNLHYLEFNRDGELIRSKLFYPRDFYAQFQWLEPQFNLEESDFGIKKNYLAIINRYKYRYHEDNLYLTVNDPLSQYTLKIDSQRRLLEDEYYSYSYTQDENKSSVLKRRKGSRYDYRRIETTIENNKTIILEYINNRFPQSKKVITTSATENTEIFISQSRIKAKKEELNNGLLISDTIVDLSWRNKINPWPDINFDPDITFQEFVKSIGRDFKPVKSFYTYDNGRVIKIEKYELNENREKLISIEDIKYNDNDKLSEVVLTTDPLDENTRKYKTYKYDEFENWYEKVVGEEVYQDGELVRVPKKRYVKTLTYWN